MNKQLRKATISAACLAGLLGAAGSAKAIGFDLGQANAGIAVYAGPYAHVEITWVNSTTATVVFTALSSPDNTLHYAMGTDGAVGLNVNAASFTGTRLAAIARPGGSGVLTDLSNGGADNEDGFGSFNYTLNDFDGWTHAMTYISLTLVNVSGTWATAADVLTANADGHLAAAHIFVGNSTWTGDALSTGYATDGHNVPDGGTTLSLVGISLAALGLLRRKLS